MKLSNQLINQLSAVLQNPSNARPIPVRLWQRLVKQGWVSRSDLEDLLLATEFWRQYAIDWRRHDADAVDYRFYFLD